MEVAIPGQVVLEAKCEPKEQAAMQGFIMVFASVSALLEFLCPVLSVKDCNWDVQAFPPQASSRHSFCHNNRKQSQDSN